MRRQHYILMAAGGSLLLMLGAFGFQHLGGLYPCKMCIWQRYPHVVAIALGAIAVLFRHGAARAWLALLGAVSALTTAGIGLYHVGVEQGWWPGPTTCTAGDIGELSTDQLLDQIMSAPLIRCDEIAWAFAGLSMAGWNAVISLALAGLWLMAWRTATQ